MLFVESPIRPTSLPALNEEQTVVYKEILEWLRHCKRNHLCDERKLQAPAGRGKTFLLNYIAANNPDLKIIMLAPTNAAASLLPEGRTVHSALNLRPRKDGEFIYLEQVSVPRLSGDVIAVDERSMISAELREFLLGTGLPILYVGDKYQLPPVELGEDGKPLEHGIVDTLNIHEWELTVNMRSKGAINSNVEAIRSGIVSRRFVTEQDGAFQEDPSMLWTETFSQFSSRLTQERISSFLKGESVVACATWAVIDRINNAIRLKAFRQQAMTNKFLVGELILVKETACAPDRENYQTRFRTRVKANSNTTGFVKSVELMESPFTNNDDFPALQVEVHRIEADTTEGNLTFYVPTAKGAKALKLAKDKLRVEAKKVRGAAAKELWTKYYFLSEVHHDVVHGYARTVNRLQGQTIPTVYTSINDVLNASFGGEYLAYRRLMVANSRASKQLIYLY